MTYNVRGCTVAGSGGSVERVAAVIADAGVDVVALQEVWVDGELAPGRDQPAPRAGGERRRRGAADWSTGRPRNQPAELAARLGWQVHYQPALAGEGWASFGNALLSRLPMRLVAGGLLPRLAVGFVREPRGISWLAVTVGSVEVQVLVTHLGLSRRERRVQLDALLGNIWLGEARCQPPRLLCGDLNCRPGTPEHRRLAEVLVDAALVAPPRGGSATFPALRPLVRLDHVLVSPDLRVRRTEVLSGRALRRASDHLPLVVELEVAQVAAAALP